MDFSKISEKLAKIFFSKISEETQNEVLIQMSKIFASAMREDDLLCRMGGDEFLIFAGNIKDKYVFVFRFGKRRQIALSNKRNRSRQFFSSYIRAFSSLNTAG